MKNQHIIHDLQEFLGLSQKQLAGFFNVSRDLVNKATLGNRRFPFRHNQRLLDMLLLMTRLKAEASEKTEPPHSFSAAFLQDRLQKIEVRMGVLQKEIAGFKHKQKTRQNALLFYQSMSAGFTDLTPLEEAWIKKETDLLVLGSQAKGNLENWQWELHLLQMEKMEILAHEALPSNQNRKSL